MALAAFLRSLFEDGRVRLPAFSPFGPSAEREADHELTAFDRLNRLEAPGDSPALNLPAARWAAGVLFRACQFVVHREVPAEIVVRELSVPCPSPRGVSVDYSADLTLRFLPDVLNFARTAAEIDPLVTALIALCQQWPLSSVGVASVGDVDLGSILDEASLQTLYVDRILTRGDAARLEDRRVREAVEAAVGAHRELAGKLVPLLSALQETPA